MTIQADFHALHAAMRAQVDNDFLPCVSTAILQGRDVVDRFCYGMADREAGTALREDHIFRMFSSTKLVTSCAVMLLLEAGKFALDDPIEAYIPALANRQVLRPGAKRIDDTEPAKSSITLRHLMAHTSGLSYGIFDPGSVQYEAYNQAGVLHRGNTLVDMINTLAPLPLSFHPGTRWEYSVATDVLAYLVEVVTGESFGGFLARRIFEPLGMVDTGFWLPPAKFDRLCALYIGVEPMDPSRPGLKRLEDKPYPGWYQQPPVRESGGAGLVSTLPDTVRLLQSLMPGGPTLLKRQTIHQMWQNQLPPGVCIEFPNRPREPGHCFALGSAVTLAAEAGEPAAAKGEVGWGGLAGTIWWINPRIGIAAALMTQRYFGVNDPYAFEFKREAYRALGF
jgi:CubicO group peptidase (beta-lactamase class C family)